VLQDFNVENANHESKQIPKSAGTSPDSSDELFSKSRAFQRSLSEIVSDDSKEQENDKKMVSGRRRNNSGGVGGRSGCRRNNSSELGGRSGHHRNNSGEVGGRFCCRNDISLLLFICTLTEEHLIFMICDI
jgi:hypothetical protein